MTPNEELALTALIVIQRQADAERAEWERNARETMLAATGVVYGRVLAPELAALGIDPAKYTLVYEEEPDA